MDSWPESYEWCPVLAIKKPGALAGLRYPCGHGLRFARADTSRPHFGHVLSFGGRPPSAPRRRWYSRTISASGIVERSQRGVLWVGLILRIRSDP